MLKSFDSSFFNSTANTDNVATSDSFAIPNAPFMSVAEQGPFLRSVYHRQLSILSSGLAVRLYGRLSKDWMFMV